MLPKRTILLIGRKPKSSLETLIPSPEKWGRLFKFVNGGQRHSTATMVCTLLITYIIHCCLELNFLGMMLPLQELTSAGNAVENTCDQDLSPRGRKLKLWVYFIGFVQHSFYQFDQQSYNNAYFHQFAQYFIMSDIRFCFYLPGLSTATLSHYNSR